MDPAADFQDGEETAKWMLDEYGTVTAHWHYDYAVKDRRRSTEWLAGFKNILEYDAEGRDAMST